MLMNACVFTLWAMHDLRFSLGRSHLMLYDSALVHISLSVSLSVLH